MGRGGGGGEGGGVGENSKSVVLCKQMKQATSGGGVEVTGGNRQDDTFKLDPHYIRISQTPQTKSRSMAIVRVAWASRGEAVACTDIE